MMPFHLLDCQMKVKWSTPRPHLAAD